LRQVRVLNNGKKNIETTCEHSQNNNNYVEIIYYKDNIHRAMQHGHTKPNGLTSTARPMRTGCLADNSAADKDNVSVATN